MPVGTLDLTLADGAILVGVILFALTKLAELRGWTRSTALVRQENADLRERNATLQAEVDRLAAADREKGERIAALEALVAKLQENDQAAVLRAIEKHEESVGVMWRQNIEAAGQLAELMRDHEKNVAQRAAENHARHNEAMQVWREISNSVRRENR